MAKVYLAVGHGRRPDGTVDPGATLGSATEQNQGGPIVAAAAKRLRDVYGQTVKYQRPGDPNFPGYTAEANAWGADLAVTVHHDWSGAPRGAFGHWHSDSPASKRLADAMYDSVRKADLPLRPSWHRARNELYFVRNTRMPAVLWECDRIGSVKNLAGYGRLLADGIADYLGVKPKAPPTPHPDTLKDPTVKRLVQVEGSNTAYELVVDPSNPTVYARRRVRSPGAAAAVTGDLDWRKNLVVLTSAEARLYRDLG